MNEQPIPSEWTFETATWNRKKNKYEDRQYRTESRTIKMEIEDRGEESIIRFIGGPTGFESYHISDFLLDKDVERDTLCICGGTVNSWPKCIVPWQPVISFILKFVEENK